MYRYYVGILITFVLILILVLLVVHKPGKGTVPLTNKPLYDYATTNSEVRLTIDGPINANIDHQQVQITANANTVTFDQLQGYEGKVVVQQQFVNSNGAYSAFLRALSLAGYTNGNTAKALSNEQGYCPLGARYVFELIENNKDLLRFWATSCSGVTKTYNGDLPLTLSLFEAQVPNYQTLVRNVNL